MRTLLAGRYEFQRPLGNGSFGVVNLYRDILGAPGTVVALKSIPYAKILEEGHRLIREIEIMLFLREKHPHIINCFNVFIALDSRGAQLVPAEAISGVVPECEQPQRALECLQQWLDEAQLVKQRISEALSRSKQLIIDNTDPSIPSFSVHLVLPFMNGDVDRFVSRLRKDIRANPLMTNEGGGADDFISVTIAVIAFQVLFGMDFLHKSHIVHRDLKPENILLRLDTNNAYCTSAIIADFGLATLESNAGTFYVCTRTYRPPELIVGRQVAHSSIDIWSLGCILYELVTVERLFDIKSSRSETGEWNGSQAAGQLETVMNIIGTPSTADTQKYIVDTKDPVRSYLLKTQPRPSVLRSQLLRKFILPGCSDEIKEMWVDLVGSCLAFFPEQRPTAEELCRHPLFAAYGMRFGDNVHQCPSTPYEAVCRISRSRDANALTIIGQVIDHLERDIALSCTADGPRPFTSSNATPISSPCVQPKSTALQPCAPANPSAPLAGSSATKAVSFPFLRTEDLSDKYVTMPLSTMEDVLDATDACECDLMEVREQREANPGDEQLLIREDDLNNLLNYLSQLVSWTVEPGDGDEEEEQYESSSSHQK